MRLPVPSAKEVESFRVLCKRELSLELTHDEAQHYATKIVQLYYALNYEIHPLCPKVE